MPARGQSDRERHRVVTVTVNALGQGSGQGAGGNAKRCVDTRGFRIPLPFHARGRVTGATVYVNGRVKRVARGRNIRAIVVKRLPQGRFKVLIVARTSRGFTVTSVRSYIGCRKTPRRDRVNRRARHPSSEVRRHFSVRFWVQNGLVEPFDGSPTLKSCRHTIWA